MSTSNTDMRHLLSRDEADNPASDPRHGDLARQLVDAATSRRAGTLWPSAVRCIARVRRKTCGAWLDVTREGAERIEWSCKTCGVGGAITSFEHSAHDMSPYIPRKKTVLWGLDQESRDMLYMCTALIPSLRAVVSRASPLTEIKGFLRVDATIDELDEIYTLVEHLYSIFPGRRKRELLDAPRRDLCGAMDRF